MMEFIEAGADLSGYSAADIVVGKAVAMLFVKCGIKSVYAKVLSDSGAEFLKKEGVPFEYETLTDRIINRDGTDICPMEKEVLDVSNVEEAYAALKRKLQSLENNRNQ